MCSNTWAVKAPCADAENGTQHADPLTDNAYIEDGYRYHDVFHFAYAAVLAWSPVTRGLLDCKRRSDPTSIRSTMAGRAGVTEEGISQLVYQYAKTRNMLRGATEVEQAILRTIQGMTRKVGKAALLKVADRAPTFESSILRRGAGLRHE